VTNNAEVFVYGATGYTGRLVCQQLAQRGIPFAVGGRNAARVQQLCEEFPDAVPAPVEHTVEQLASAFANAKVVVNCTGPFSLLGNQVVEAALRANCHYLDTTGEQDFMLDVDERYGPSFVERQRVAICANSWYFALGICAAELCLETTNVDTLQVLYAVNGQPTVASQQSLLRTARRPGFHLAQGRLAPNTIGDLRQVKLPGNPNVVESLAIPGGETVYLRGDQRVRNLEVRLVTDQLQRTLPVFRAWHALSRFFGDYLDPAGDWIVARVAKTPPPEDPQETRFTVAAYGQGDAGRVRCELFGARPYVVTGFLCAQAAQWLLERSDDLDGPTPPVGALSTASAFGAQRVLTALRTVGVEPRLDGKPLKAPTKRRPPGAARTRP